MEQKTKLLAAERALELTAILVMLYAALGSVRLFFNVELNAPLILILCAIYGGIDLAGTLLGQRRISFAVLAGSVLLVFFALSRIGYAAEAVAAPAGYLLLLLIHSFDWPRRIFSLTVTACVAGSFLRGGEPPRLLIAAAVLLLLKEITAVYGRRFSVQLLPLLLSASVVIALLPVSDTPFDWSFVLRAGESVADLVNNIARDVRYFFSTPDGSSGLVSGYGGRGGLSGALYDSDLEELYLSRKSSRGNLYLKGQEFGELVGEHWKDADTSERPYSLWYTDFLNVLIAGGISEEKANTFAELRETELTYGYLKTRDVIRPANLLLLDSEAPLTENANAFDYRNVQGKKYRYKVRFLDLDYANPYLIELLEHPPQAEPAPYNQLAEVSRTYFLVDLEKVCTREEYVSYVLHQAGTSADPYSAGIPEDTLAVSGATERMKELAAAITEGCGSDFEKGKAIETFLRSYPYSAGTDLRGSESFIDDFLFETQEGYCVHYASAMVMLLRLNGIPARLVEGYCCDYSYQNPNRSFTIFGSNAHVWAEACIKGFGWVRFEPTASMPSAEIMGWGLRVQTAADPSDSSGETVTPEPVRPTPPKPETAGNELPAVKPEAEEENVLPGLARSLSLILALSLLMLLVLYLLGKKIPYRFQGESGRLEADLEDMRWLIRKLRPGQWSNRPLLDYAAALDSEELRHAAEDAFLLYYRLRYKELPPSEAEWESLRRARQGIYELYLKSAGVKRRRAALLAFLSCHTGFSRSSSLSKG